MGYRKREMLKKFQHDRDFPKVLRKKRDVHAERASQETWGGWFLRDKDWGRETAVGIG